MFNNEIFDSWLNKKSDEILSKVDREKISTEEMIILVLKAQTNHFHHMDIDMKKSMSDMGDKFNGEFKSINHQFEDISQQFKRIDQQFVKIDQQFEKVDQRFEKIDQRFEKIDQRFEKIDQRFERMDQKIDNRFMWMIGITIAMSGGIYLKLFLG